ncbi:NAD(P)/FAD-dependent oxidoreductase [Streptomyces sp. A475]|uniref:NAD(P)/FAD-dependent oxidoreductase n=1 Tax=Streptomyces sp. A475 TaxID=3131976 RepID=UPI0030C9F352
MYDAIVVGARCAGSPTALLLARAGHRVLLLDRASFPSDTLSTHVVHQPGVAALARWGLLDRVRASGCPPVDRVVYEVADIRITGGARGLAGQRAWYAPRRHVLDAVLVESAVAAGVEFRGGCTVRNLLRDATGRVSGVEFRHRGRTPREHAALVIGADGMRSTVARLCDAPYTVRHPRLTCAYYTYWDSVGTDMELYERQGGWVATVPTHGGASLVLAYFPQRRFDDIRADSGPAYAEQIRATAPGLAARLVGTRPLERLRGSGDQRNFFRRPAGPGWALVGDAAHHKDSITARGITDAFTQAETLVRHAGPRLVGSPPGLDRALRAYERECESLLAPGYRATLSAARLHLSEQRLSVLRAVSSDPELTSIYLDVFAGITTAEALYVPRLFARL